MTLVLGIESSCDETAAAVVEDGRRVYSNVIASQHDLHRMYGGVVPEIASRAHVERIGPVVLEALEQAGATLQEIDVVAVGNRPGLIGSLLVGVSAAKALAWALDRPLLGVDHVQAHLYAAALLPAKRGEVPAAGHGEEAQPPAYPALGLVVSGGHTSLYEVNSPTELRLLGRTIDDAVGEAYDKAAVILQLPYPGGPHLDKLAQSGNPAAYPLPRSLLGPGSLDFSFSGLKTALLYQVRGKPQARGGHVQFPRDAAQLSAQERADTAASFQAAAVQTLIIKLERGVAEMTARGRAPRCLLIGGGVSANSELRRQSLALGARLGLATPLPAMQFCLDNAAMVAGLGYQQWRLGQRDGLDLPALASGSV